MSAPVSDRRVVRRVPLTAGATIAHELSERQFPARCVDGSAAGLMMYVPLTTPVAVGQYVQVTLGDVPQEPLRDLARATRRARVVRVDRGKVTMGQMSVGLAFVEE